MAEKRGGKSWADLVDDEAPLSEVEGVPLWNRLEEVKYNEKGMRVSTEMEETGTEKQRKKSKKKSKEGKERLETVEEAEEDGMEGKKVRKPKSIVVETQKESDAGSSKDGVQDEAMETQDGGEDVLVLNVDSDEEEVGARTFASVVKAGSKELVKGGEKRGAVSKGFAVKTLKVTTLGGVACGRRVSEMEEKVCTGKKKIWEKVKEIKGWIDELEDGGADRRTVRKVRSALDGILEATTEVEDGSAARSGRMDGRRMKCDETVGMTDFEEPRAILERVVTEVETQPLVEQEGASGGSGSGSRGEKQEKWFNKKVGTVTTDDLLIQIYDGADDWTMDKIREAFWRFSNLEEDGVRREEVRRWRFIKRQRAGIEGSTFIVRVPLASYLSLTRARDNRVRIEGRWVKFSRYVDLPTCWRCSGYGHVKDRCEKAYRCRKCGEGHPPAECRTKSLRCVTCVEIGMTEVGHRALGADCPSHNLLLEEKRMRVAVFVAGME